LGELEIAEEADQGRQDTARLGPVDCVDRLAGVLESRLAHDGPAGYEWDSSRTGGTSSIPIRAGGKRGGTAEASSWSLASMTRNRPSCSFVSANGPSVVETLPPRTRIVRAVREGCSAFETM